MTSCPRCKGTTLTGVQYCMTPEDYDGVSEWICHTCGQRWGRWTGNRLMDGELEPRYGVTREVRSGAKNTV